MSHAERFPFLLAAEAVRRPDAGVRSLAPGQVVGLQARHAHELRVLQGRVWVTAGGGQTGWLRDAGGPVSGDVVMRAGEVLQVPAGKQVVVESWPEAGDPVVRVGWAAKIRPLTRGAAVHGVRWLRKSPTT